MAKSIHIVTTAVRNVNSLGSLVDKNDVATSINDVATSEMRHVVLPSDDVPNSAGYPTVEAYLRLEAAGDYVLKHLDQYKIITYLET